MDQIVDFPVSLPQPRVDVPANIGLLLRSIGAAGILEYFPSCSTTESEQLQQQGGATDRQPAQTN